MTSQVENCRVLVAHYLMMSPPLRMVGTVKTLAAIGATMPFVEMVSWAVSRWPALLNAKAKLGQPKFGEQIWWMNTASRTIAQHNIVMKYPQAEHCRVPVAN